MAQNQDERAFDAWADIVKTHPGNKTKHAKGGMVGKTKFNKGGMVGKSPKPGHVGPGTCHGGRDYGK
jgi:hypothetical protein